MPRGATRAVGGGGWCPSPADERGCGCWPGSRRVVLFVAAALVAESAEYAAVVWVVCSASSVRDDMVWFSAVRQPAGVVVESHAAGAVEVVLTAAGARAVSDSGILAGGEYSCAESLV